MGVPSFYRWLVNKYPKIVSDASDERANGLEFDNLYLDMNGIIHPCFHPEDNLFPPTTFEGVFENIYNYIDELFNIVRPRKLLYMAIDGVAPRAKMNQQRTRRFRTAKDTEDAEEVEKKLRKQFEVEGKKVSPKGESELSDSNIITPGTEFMYLLSKKLQCYIKRQMTNDSHWQRIKVILSDANVPGEGEHKIMSFIRAQRCSEGYNPNTRHCLYGLDADLIMLALATHEVHLSILRETILPGQEPGSCRPEVALGSEKPYNISEGNKNFNRREPVKKTPFQFLHVWLLREYLQVDLNISNPPENVKVDLERIIDDFIFICFFTGNDFLPHMPTLEIHEGAIDLLMHVYREEFKDLGGYLVDTQRIEDEKGGYIKLKRVEKFILSVGKNEEEIFKKRSEIRDRKLRRIQSELLNAQETEDHECIEANLQSSPGKMSGIVDASSGLDEKEVTDFTESQVLENTRELKQKLKDYIRHQSDTFKNGVPSDKVRLAVPGWKKRYYEVKFFAKTPEEMESMRKKLVGKYTEGLCWVLKYYFSGVPSWTWFYPYYYGPFASDLKGLSQVKIKFQKGLPLKPFEQLLAVLPPRSGHALPEVYRKLMVDDESKIFEFYPTRFKMDADGKRFMWQAICQIPFIQEDLLLEETRKVEKELKGHERERNEETADQLFVGSSSGLGEQISSAYNSYPLLTNNAVKIDKNLSDGVRGFMHLCEEIDPDVLCVLYKLPQDFNPILHLLEGVNIPEKTITEADIVETGIWHETSCSGTGRLSMSKNYVPKSSPKNREPDIISKDAGIGWGRGRGKSDYSTLQKWQKTALKAHAQCVKNEFPPPSICSTSANSLSSRFETQLVVSASAGMVETSLRHETSCSAPCKLWVNKNPDLRSKPNNRESEIIHKGAGNGWGRGRGKSDNFTPRKGQNTSLNSHPQSVGNKFAPLNSCSTSASSLSSGVETQLVFGASCTGWNGWQHTDKGLWQNSLTSSASPDGRQSESFSSAFPRQQAQSRSFSSAYPWQQVQGQSFASAYPRQPVQSHSFYSASPRQQAQSQSLSPAYPWPQAQSQSFASAYPRQRVQSQSFYSASPRQRAQSQSYCSAAPRQQAQGRGKFQ